MNKIYLTKQNLRKIVEFTDSFPESGEMVTITVENDSGIGSIINASVETTIRDHLVTVSKEIDNEESW
jgi:uncharacterized protein YajQ (UPF0234 family)